jgi:hypothetical protein
MMDMKILMVEIIKGILMVMIFSSHVHVMICVRGLEQDQILSKRILGKEICKMRIDMPRLYFLCHLVYKSKENNN